jgi:flagellar basal-body rod modification protein FlgD
MTVVTNTIAPTMPGTPGATGRDYASLGQSDFLRLLTVQVQQQDPFDPVDNKEMLAQMAQFSSLAGINDVNATLQKISDKLDVLAAAQAAPGPTE